MTAHEGNICFVSRESHAMFSSNKMFPVGAFIECFVMWHKQNKPQLLKQNKFVTRMRVEIQTNSSPCSVLSVYGVLFIQGVLQFKLL